MATKKVRMFRTEHMVNEGGQAVRLHGGQEYELPEEIADDFIGVGAAYVLESGKKVQTKNMGRPKGVKNADRRQTRERTARRTRHLE
jgi:hypothetical protein